MLKYLVCIVFLAGGIFAQDAFIKKGDTESRVREILGPPTQAGGSGNRKTLIYGKSKILFQNGAVISFYPGELKREVAKIRSSGHPKPNIRKEDTAPSPENLQEDVEYATPKRPSLSKLKAERAAILDKYRADIVDEIKRIYRGLDVIRKRRGVKAADEVQLNQLAESYELTPGTVPKEFKGFIGRVRIDRKLEGDMAIVSNERLARPVLAIGFGLENTPVGESGVLGVLKENGTFVETRRNDNESEFVIVEPILSQSAYRGSVELTAKGLEKVKETEEHEEREDTGNGESAREFNPQP